MEFRSGYHLYDCLTEINNYVKKITSNDNMIVYNLMCELGHLLKNNKDEIAKTRIKKKQLVKPIDELRSKIFKHSKNIGNDDSQIILDMLNNIKSKINSIDPNKFHYPPGEINNNYIIHCPRRDRSEYIGVWYLEILNEIEIFLNSIKDSKNHEILMNVNTALGMVDDIKHLLYNTTCNEIDL